MRSRIDSIAASICGNLDESGTTVMVRWNEYPADAVPDPTTSALSGMPTAKCETIKAFVHFVQPASAQVRQFAEIETGDCIMEYAPDVCLEGRRDVRFEIAKVLWSAKPLSELLKETWDATQAGVNLYKVLLLKRATG